MLIAERLDGRPLGSDHGAPARLVSPRQYGYISTKHLCRIKLHSGEPTQVHSAYPVSRLVLNGPFIKAHPRARVWEEERHPHLPAWSLRHVYRLLIPPLTFLSARGSREDADGDA